MTSSPVKLKQPLIAREENNFERSMRVLQRCAFMLRRKVGHEVEDKHYDKMVRSKLKHSAVFSWTGVIATVALDTFPHYQKIKGGDIYGNADEFQKTVLVCLQLILSLTTFISVALIIQYYHILLMNKRKEWSGIDLTPAPTYEETAAEKHRRLKETYDLTHSYSIWASSTFKYEMFVEIIIHLIHPVIWFSENNAFFEACKVIVLCRLYIFLKLLHINSGGYKNRFEIVNQDEEFREMSLKITQNSTLKAILYNHTVLTLALWGIATIGVGAFGMFLVERDADSTESWAPSPIDWAGSMENTLWFAFVCATTIGYGDYYPSTLKGRFMAVAIGLLGLIVVIVFQALLTNQLKRGKNEKYIDEYLRGKEAEEKYENCAAILIQRVWRVRRALKYYNNIPIFHKHNIIFGAMKQLREVRFLVQDASLGSSDLVIEEKLDELSHQANEVGMAIQEQRDTILSIHKKFYKSLKLIRKEVKARTAATRASAPANNLSINTNSVNSNNNNQFRRRHVNNSYTIT